ncbi:MAG TPA: hypothetical protein VMA72_13710 [Streptosporangiaceae bacterium]|nr:hypothetical protein [Streptosporangiaceae bacterium]
MSADPGDALDVLRAVWRSQGQTGANLNGESGQTDEAGENKSCKRMTDAGVGFDDFAAGEGDLGSAWRARLQREGKLNDSGGSIRDLVLGPAETR